MKEFNLDGIDLSSEGAAAEILSRQADNIAGLKLKNTDLIAREASAKSDFEASQLETEQEKHNAAKALAEKDGSIAVLHIVVRSTSGSSNN